MGLQRMTVVKLEFAKPSTWVLDLANARVERMGMQRTMVATLGFANPSNCVLDLANAMVKGDRHAKDDGGDTWICQLKHLCA